MARPTGDAPEVSVVIPTKDRRHLLARTLSTVLAQEDVALEAIVVDDGSRDRTADYLRHHGDPRVRTLRNERPLGPAASRNRGIADAAGKWVAFLDDDDLWAPNKLRQGVEAAIDAAADIVYTAGLRVSVDGEPRVTAVLDARDPPDLAEALIDNNVVPALSGVMARTAIVQRLGGFDERLHILADWEMWLRLFTAAPVAACREPLVAYITHADAMSVTATRLAYREIEHIRQRHPNLRTGKGRPVGGEDFWLWMAWGSRVAGRRRETARAYLTAAIESRRPSHVARACAAAIGPPLFAMGRKWGLKGTSAVVPMPDWLVGILADGEPQR